jgi:hypothetical protein
MFRCTLMLTAILIAAATICAPASAQPLVRIDVVDRDTGAWLLEYRHRGQGWIAGSPGHRYGVRLTNSTSERVLVVLSVDGVNAVTGETAHPSQTGYVLAPWQSTEIAGWRKSLDDIAQFVFTDLPDSYAARTGRPDNVGTIGVAVFRERHRYPVYPAAPPIARGDGMRDAEKSSRAPAPAAAESSAADSAAYSTHGGIARQRIGTGHGAREWAPVTHTGFERASRRPAQVTQLRYDDIDALAAIGVVPRPHPYWRHPDDPQAFPDGFVADPPPR